MKTILRLLLVLILVAGGVGIIAYVDGSMLPVAHSVSVSGVIDAPSDQVFARITDVAHGSSWRPAVKSVKVLPPDQGRDKWVEDLGHGQTMSFLAVRTDPITASGNGRREVVLNDPAASYGGAWLYELYPGPRPNTTNLDITETGFINPPLYRFMMAHVFGPTRNLETYMKDMKAATAKH